MFYAKIDNGEDFTFRFYTKADRNQFVADHQAARAVSSKQAKFVAGAQKCVTYIGKVRGSWVR